MAPQEVGGQVAEATPNGFKVRIGVSFDVPPWFSVLTRSTVCICSLSESNTP